MWCTPEMRRTIMLAAALVAGLSGCGFQPLHGGGGGGPQDLATIRIERIPNRIGQKLHNRLLDRLTPKGPPARPAYVLKVSLAESLQNLAIRRDETATRANLTLTASFSLTGSGDGRTFNGTAVSTNSYNILQSDFATLSAESDARDRALRVLAEEIRARVAAALVNPQFFKKGAVR